MSGRTRIDVISLTEADLPGMTAVETACFSDPWSEESLRQALLDPLIAVYGVRVGDLLVAYGGWQCVAREGSLLSIGVLPAFRRRGCGEAILRAILSDAERRADFLTLEVRASNLPALRLYEKHGFLPVGRRAGYYDHPREDAVLMTRYFKDAKETPL
jgi:ribosomal-protein-alanine N-acetyltransferase